MSEEVSLLKVPSFDGEGESFRLPKTSPDATKWKTRTLEEKALMMDVITQQMLDVELTSEDLHSSTRRTRRTRRKRRRKRHRMHNSYRQIDDDSLDLLYSPMFEFTYEVKALFMEKPLEEIAPPMQSEPELDVELTLEEKALLMEEITPPMQSEPELDVELTLEEKALLMEEITPLMQSEPEQELERECKVYIHDSDCQRAGYSSQDSSDDSLDGLLFPLFDFTLEEKTLKMEKPLHKIAPQLEYPFKKMWQVLHIVSCKRSAELDPKKNALVPTRFYTFNTAYFNLDEESEAIHGPPIKGLPFSQFRTNAGLSNNVVSLKITESDVGYPIRVFGTVIARDVVDYKCLYLFRRERDDPQLINTPKDELILTGPRRALVTPDRIFFEINLKIKGAPGIAEGDFSKGVMEHNTICCDNRAIAISLTSWRSTVEFVCTPVPYPVEATLEVKILNGPRDVPFSSHVITWTDGYEDNPITLYEYDDSIEAGTRGSIGDDGSVALDRNLVAVPVIFPRTVDEDIAIVLDIGLMESHGAEEFTHVALRYPCEEVVCRNGSYELQLKVAWRAVRYSPNHERCLSMPVPPRTAHSWMWELIFHGSCR